MSDDAISAIRKALEEGPTPGPWSTVNVGTANEPMMQVNAARIAGRPPKHCVALCATGDSPQSMENANAAFIAACNPTAIRALLAELDAAKKEIETHRAVRCGNV